MASLLTMDGKDKPHGKKPLKTYSRKDTKAVTSEVKQTREPHDKLTEKRTLRPATDQSLKCGGGDNGKVESNKKRKLEGPTKSTNTPKASSYGKITKQRSIKKKVLAKASAPPRSPHDDAWIYASPLHSSIEVWARDQTHGHGDDIEPTPVPSNHSSSGKLPAQRQKRRRIRIHTLRQQLAVPALEEKAISVRSKRKRLTKSKTLHTIQSPIRRKGIQQGGDSFLSSELLPPSAKKRRLNGRPKANNFYLSGSAGLELAKGPLPPVRFLSVFELEQERVGGGMLQLARSKTVTFEPNITEMNDVESEPDNSRAKEITRWLADSSSDDINFRASGKGLNDETSVEKQASGVIRRLGRSPKGITPMAEPNETVNRRVLSENLFTAAARDGLIVDTNHDPLFADAQFETDDMERVTQLRNDEDLKELEGTHRSSQQSGTTQEPSANEDALCHASPLSPHSSSSASASANSPAQSSSSSPSIPGHNTLHSLYTGQRNYRSVRHSLDTNALPGNQTMKSQTRLNEQRLSTQNITNEGKAYAPQLDLDRTFVPTLDSPSAAPGHQSRRPSNKTILFDDDNDYNEDNFRATKEDEETYFDLLLESEASWSGLSDDDHDNTNDNDYSTRSGAPENRNHYSPRSGVHDEHASLAGTTTARAVQIPRSSMVMETSPHWMTGRRAEVQIPRRSVVVETSSRPRRSGGNGMVVDERNHITESRHCAGLDKSPEMGVAYGGRVVVDLFSSLKQIYDAGARGSTVSLY